MTEHRYQSAWVKVAAIAILAALVLAMLPLAHAGHEAPWLLMLPVFFVGVIVPFCLSPIARILDPGLAYAAPAIEPCFQRPPPFPVA